VNEVLVDGRQLFLQRLVEVRNHIRIALHLTLLTEQLA
jgi:hypothetical protein